MATKPGRRTYAIYYSDNTYMTYELTRGDYEKLEDTFNANKQHVKLSLGILALKDIRAVIEQREAAPVTESDEGADPILSPDELVYMKQLKGEHYGE